MQKEEGFSNTYDDVMHISIVITNRYSKGMSKHQIQPLSVTIGLQLATVHQGTKTNGSCHLSCDGMQTEGEMKG
jgi:hypothetical protein